MEISIALPHTGKFASPETTAYAAEEAERRGCSAVWVLERLLRPTNPRPSPERPSPAMPESYANVYDPLETLACVAAKTGRISLRDLGAEVTDILIPGIETVHGIAMPILLTEASYHPQAVVPRTGRRLHGRDPLEPRRRIQGLGCRLCGSLAGETTLHANRGPDLRRRRRPRLPHRTLHGYLYLPGLQRGSHRLYTADRAFRRHWSPRLDRTGGKH
jgi:hypothetical protein